MKIIFLDIRVLAGCWVYDIPIGKGLPPFSPDPQCVRYLKEIIGMTGADIVVTSSGRSYKEYLLMWECRKLPGFVTDVTPISITGKRGDEIDAWLNECKEECEYVIIDCLDESNFNKHQLSKLLVVWGIDAETVQKAIVILNPDDAEVINYKRQHNAAVYSSPEYIKVRKEVEKQYLSKRIVELEAELENSYNSNWQNDIKKKIFRTKLFIAMNKLEKAIREVYRMGDCHYIDDMMINILKEKYGITMYGLMECEPPGTCID